MQMRFARAFTLSCACAAAASAVAAVIAPRRDWGGSLPDYLTPGGGTVFVYTLANAIEVLVLHTPIILGLKWATRDRLKLSPRVWGALGLTIPLLAHLASLVPDVLWQLEVFSIWQIAWRLLKREMIVFNSLMPTMIGGAAFGWLLFKPESQPPPITKPQISQ